MAEFLLMIFFILIISRILGMIFDKKLKQPEVLGELLAGIFIGVIFVYFSNIPQLETAREICKSSAFFKVISDFGIFFLMLMAGMNMNIDSILRASRKGIGIAFGGFCLPFILGFSVGLYFLPESDLKIAQCLFLGAALSITAIAVSARVLMDLGYIGTEFGQTIISAAVIDDLLGLIAVAFLVNILEFGKIPDFTDTVLILIKIFIFLGVIIAFDKFLASYLQKYAKIGNEIEVSVSIGIALLLAYISELAGMHFMIGAFIAGILIKKLAGDKVKIVECKLSGITFGFFAPIFFVSIGLHLDFTVFKTALPFLFSLLAAAIIGKVIGCGLPAKLMRFSWRDSLGIGVGMNGRGAVELAIASIAMEVNLFNTPNYPIVQSIFSAIVMMAIITTLITSASLGFIISKKDKKRPC